jgi:hypothetical protein
MANLPQKESAKAKTFCDAYLAMGPDRSLDKLSKMEVDRMTVGLRHLSDWSRKWDWVKRAEIYDAEQLEKKRRRREMELDQLYDELALFCREERRKTLIDIDKLRNSEKGLGSIASVNLLKLLIETHLHVLGDGDKKIEVTDKGDGSLDIIVETFWGRGTDPRRKSEPIEETQEAIEEEAEISVEFGNEDEGSFSENES